MTFAPGFARRAAALLVCACVCACATGMAAAADGAAPRPAWTWDGIYKADLLHISEPSGTSAVGNLGLRWNADAGALFGWDDTTLHAELLWNHGGKPNRRIGTTQGVSNLEVAQNAARIYATWIEHEFKAAGGTGVLFGLYDLNSEFYATDASGLLIHPSFGIGIDFSQSGRNGPSIFPNLGLALRVKQPLGGGYYAQAAVIDGVPGDPANPGRTVIRLSRDDGALLGGEAGWQERGDDGPKPGHWGIGAWRYTARTARIDGNGPPAHNQGAYALAQGTLVDREAGRTIGFLRIGVADRQLNGVDLAIGTGVQVERPFGEQGPAAFTAGVAYARYSRAQRDALDPPAASHETAIEVGARWLPVPRLALQPLAQRVLNVGGRAGHHTTLVGVRAEWSFGDAAP